MSWLERRSSGCYHVVFRLEDQRFKKSLKTTNQDSAEGQRLRLDENIRLVESGRLVIPDGADVGAFLLSDGRMNGKRNLLGLVSQGGHGLRRVGIMAFDSMRDERGTWAVGLFSDAPGYSSVQGDDFGGAATMRATYLPWYDEETSGRRLLHTAIAYSHREAFGHTARFRTQPGSRLASYIIDTGNIPADSVDLMNAEAAWVLGPFSIQSEYSLGWVDAPAGHHSEIQGF